ncbi:S8 family peptidase [Actinokineospora pegani]|uniref:S8 family peptidase n=1 Tax=Actinokineospora pegani TaxID=2654637 RepID=UPI0012EA4B5D|nr:S8 family peptidase [Actinokineospora pegani]
MRKFSLAAGLGVAVVSAALVVTPAQAEAAVAEGAIVGAGSPTAIPGSYIVKLKDVSTADSGTLSSRYGGQVERVFHSALNGFTAKLTEKQAKRLAADPSVVSVEQNQVVRLAATQTNPTWGLDRIDQRNLPLSRSYTYNSTGTGVNSYVIDTGIRITHSEFAANRAKNGYDFVQNDAVAQDGNGHGTHVAGTIAGRTYGVAKNATVYAVRVLDNNGSGTIAGVIAGVDWVTANHKKPATANMSLGGGASSTLDAAVRRSIAAGVTYGLAAGNSSTNASSSSPARVSEGLTVGATTNTDARASYSNYGSVLDIFAPGTNITSAWSTGDTATRTISGTSMATPHVVGVATRYLQTNPGATPAQVASYLIGQATSGVVGNPGSGSPNRLLYAPPSL